VNSRTFSQLRVGSLVLCRRHNGVLRVCEVLEHREISGASPMIRVRNIEAPTQKYLLYPSHVLRVATQGEVAKRLIRAAKAA